MPINQDRMNAFLGKFVLDAGAITSAPLIILGDKLGLYKALAAAGPSGLDSAGLADKARIAERYAREWLLNQAAGGYIEYTAATRRFHMTEEQAAALADDASPFNILGGFYIGLSMIRDLDKLEEPFRTGAGLPWGGHDCNLFCGTDRFFAASYRGHLVSQWLPALDGVVAKLERGAAVADVGCGHGASTLIMATAFPNSRFTGVDAHAPSIECARNAAKTAGIGARCTFETADSAAYAPAAGGFDLICFFDCLHDMGDPVGAAAHARKALNTGGTAMIVEPMAGDRPEDNMNPVGRIFSAASTMICVPASLSSNGPALGAQAGPARLKQVLSDAGFKNTRVATQTPFNLIIEAR